MKFCTKCGAELVDEAMICTKCGCMLEGMAPRVNTAAPRQRADGLLDAKQTNAPSLILTIFNFLFSVFALTSLFFFALALVENYLYANLSYYSNEFYIHGDMRFEDDFIIMSLVAAGTAFGSAVVSFVMTLIEKHRLERLFSAISKLCASALLAVVAIYILA